MMNNSLNFLQLGPYSLEMFFHFSESFLDITRRQQTFSIVSFLSLFGLLPFAHGMLTAPFPISDFASPEMCPWPILPCLFFGAPFLYFWFGPEKTLCFCLHLAAVWWFILTVLPCLSKCFFVHSYVSTGTFPPPSCWIFFSQAPPPLVL